LGRTRTCNPNENCPKGFKERASSKEKYEVGWVSKKVKNYLLEMETHCLVRVSLFIFHFEHGLPRIGALTNPWFKNSPSIGENGVVR
jgi:hypothetical protein